MVQLERIFFGFELATVHVPLKPFGIIDLMNASFLLSDGLYFNVLKPFGGDLFLTIFVVVNGEKWLLIDISM